MTPHINGIVQSTRRLLAIEEQLVLVGPHDDTRAGLEATWKAESDNRQALVLAAIRDGVDGDLMRWAIGMQAPEMRALVDVIVDALQAAGIPAA